jgi:hypothetical protein
MSGELNPSEPRRTRWLPAFVFSLFAMVALADAVVVVLYGNYRNLIEEKGVEMAFRPSDASIAPVAERMVEVVDGCTIVAEDGKVLVEVVGDRIRVSAPGNLVLRFRAHNAGLFVEFGYRFGPGRRHARCNLTVARVASRYGLDYMCRRSLVARKKAKGVVHQYLADHAGWFEISLEINEAAAAGGFEISRPEIVRD